MAAVAHVTFEFAHRVLEFLRVREKFLSTRKVPAGGPATIGSWGYRNASQILTLWTSNKLGGWWDSNDGRRYAVDKTPTAATRNTDQDA